MTHDELLARIDCDCAEKIMKTFIKVDEIIADYEKELK